MRISASSLQITAVALASVPTPPGSATVTASPISALQPCTMIEDRAPSTRLCTRARSARSDSDRVKDMMVGWPPNGSALTKHDSLPCSSLHGRSSPTRKPLRPTHYEGPDLDLPRRIRFRLFRQTSTQHGRARLLGTLASHSTPHPPRAHGFISLHERNRT
ncbi:hypothetical protein V8E36_008214 [Tilletia maclaganii]